MYFLRFTLQVRSLQMNLFSVHCLFGIKIVCNFNLINLAADSYIWFLSDLHI